MVFSTIGITSHFTTDDSAGAGIISDGTACLNSVGQSRLCSIALRISNSNSNTCGFRRAIGKGNSASNGSRPSSGTSSNSCLLIVVSRRLYRCYRIIIALPAIRCDIRITGNVYSSSNRFRGSCGTASKIDTCLIASKRNTVTSIACPCRHDDEAQDQCQSQ